MAPHEQHRPHGPLALKFGVITASDSRIAATDDSGRLVRELLELAGHRVVAYDVLPDTPELIAAAVRASLARGDGVILSGGTGIAPRDSTIEAVRPLLDKELDGFGELFRMLSYQEIGTAAMLSRAIAGVSGGKIVAALPGSSNACRLAMEKLIIPELGHLAHLLGLGGA